MRMLRRVGQMTGHALQARDGEIGVLEEVYFDDAEWTVRYLVVRTGSWLSGREVLVAPRSVTGIDHEGKRVAVDLTRAQIERSPPVETERPVSRHYEAAYYEYYGWEPYWAAAAMGGVPVGPAGPTPKTAERLPPPAEPHLRSSREVRGYALHALDGAIGHVEDFVVDDDDWRVRYLEVDTRNWLPGRKVLLAPAWITGVRWIDRAVFVKFERETIRGAPAYDRSRPIGPEDELSVFQHFSTSPENA